MRFYDLRSIKLAVTTFLAFAIVTSATWLSGARLTGAEASRSVRVLMWRGVNHSDGVNPP